jgi:hypothetical protein
MQQAHELLCILRIVSDSTVSVLDGATAKYAYPKPRRDKNNTLPI